MSRKIFIVLTQFKIICFFSPLRDWTDPDPVAAQSPEVTERIRVHTTLSRQTPADNRAVQWALGQDPPRFHSLFPSIKVFILKSFASKWS